MNAQNMSKIAEEEEFDTFWIRMEKIQEAWRGYIEDGRTPPEDVIRPEIFASWMRCRAGGLDPYHINIPSIVPQTVTKRLAANQDLISITAYFFDAYADLLGDKVFAMDLYDKELYLIKTFGTSMIVQQRKEHARIGALKDESVAGTNAMGIAKRTGKPCQMIGAEHYDVNLHGRVCTSIPVFSAKREFWGVINVVQNSTPSAKYTFETMIALSKGLESLVQQAEKQRQLEAANALTRTILEEIDSAIFVVDPSSCIIEANNKAKEIMDPPVWPVGKSVVDCFGINNPFSRVLMEQKTIDNKEITLQTNGERKHYIATIRPIFYQQNKLWGVLGTLDNLDTTRKLMRNIVGWKAVFQFEDIIGESPLLRQAVMLARQTASLMSNTLILGESGTGKELFAQSIHNASEFSKGPFVAVNCAAIPIGLLESELFGYEGGAFTGAKKSGAPGKFELADGGTIFLDEINSIPQDVQVKLLRVLQEKAVTRIGGTSSISLNLKIIAASNVDLNLLVSQNLFRADLYYRLNVITIEIPPLRKRVEDIPLLVEKILQNLQEKTKKTYTVSQDALDDFEAYHWPGNVREMENILERACIQSVIRGDHRIDHETLQTIPELFARREPAKWKQNEPNGEPGAEETISISPIKTSEKSVIIKTFEKNRWNISKTAKALGISRNTLYNRIKQYQISIPE